MNNNKDNTISIQLLKITNKIDIKEIINISNNLAYEFLRELYKGAGALKYLEHSNYNYISFSAKIPYVTNKEEFKRKGIIIKDREITLIYNLQDVYKFDFSNMDQDIFFNRCNIK